MKELEIIQTIKNTLSDSSLIGDDTACVDNIILTQDTLVEDIHFRLSTISPHDLGIKSIAVNLSDIAAAGGIAKYVLISISLPAHIESIFVKKLYEGINEICTKHDVKVAGGDVTGGDKVSISVTAIGYYEGVIPASRHNAAVGDIIAVTGFHGSSRAGLEILEKNIEGPERFIKAHINPEPKLKIGRTIAKKCINPTMMDSSDGLADALYKIGKASNVTLNVDFNDIPYDEDLVKIASYNIKNWVLFGGEDYELVTCITQGQFDMLTMDNLPIYKIGHVTEKQDAPAIIHVNNCDFKITEEILIKGAYDHFQEEHQ